MTEEFFYTYNLPVQGSTRKVYTYLFKWSQHNARVLQQQHRKHYTDIQLNIHVVLQQTTIHVHILAPTSISIGRRVSSLASCREYGEYCSVYDTTSGYYYDAQEARADNGSRRIKRAHI